MRKDERLVYEMWAKNWIEGVRRRAEFLAREVLKQKKEISK